MYLLQVVTVEPGGLSRDHDDKIRLLIVSSCPNCNCCQIAQGLALKLACMAQGTFRTRFTITLLTVSLHG